MVSSSEILLLHIRNLGCLQLQLRPVGVHEQPLTRRPIRGEAVQRRGAVHVNGQLRRRPLLRVLSGRQNARANRPRAVWIVEAESGLGVNRLGLPQRDPVETPVVGRYQQLAAGAEDDAHLSAARPVVHTAQGVVGASDVLHEAVARVADDRDTGHHLVLDERSADGGFGAELGMAAGGQPGGPLERVGRLAAHDVDRASDRVAPVQRPLRAPQDLDPLDVQEIHGHHRGPCEVDAVEVHRGAGIAAWDQATFVPTPRILTCARPAKCRDGQRRHEPRQAFHGVHAQLFERPCRHCRDGNGRRLDIGGAGLRGGHRYPFEDRGDGQHQIQRGPTAIHVDVAGIRLKAAERRRDRVVPWRQRTDLVLALPVREAGPRGHPTDAGNADRDTGQDAAHRVPDHAGEVPRRRRGRRHARHQQATGCQEGPHFLEHGGEHPWMMPPFTPDRP